MNKIFNKIWPLGVIFIVWIIFSYPYFFKGKMPYSSTYQVNNFAPWDAYPKFAGPVKNGAMPDITTQIYPWKHFTIEAFKKGQIPLWNPNSFAGTPHLANYQSAVLSPLNLLFFILPFQDAWSILVLLQPLFAGIFLYLFLRELSVSKLACVFSSISFMFCGFIIVWMDYATLAYAILFLPLAFFAVEKYIYSKNAWYLILLSLTVLLSFFSGHFQISIYFLAAVLAYELFKFFQTKNIRQYLLILFSTLSGILLSMPQILPSLEFYSQALRSSLFQVGEVIPWAYLPTFIAPDFFGNPVTRNDWFGHYAEWNAYIGLIPLMLAFYALKKKKKEIYIFFIFAILAVLLAFPTPILDAVIALHIPVLSTSAASRIIVIYSFFFILLSAFGFDELIADIKKQNKKPVLIWLISFIAVFSCLWIIILLKKFIPLEKITIAKQNLIFPTILFLVLTVFVSISVFFKKIVKINVAFFLSVILVLIISFDMLRFATKWQAFDPKNLAFAEIPVTGFFQKISGYQRVIGNFGAETAVYYDLPSLEGYDPLYINRYGEFVEFLREGQMTKPERSVVTFPRDGKYTAKAINLLNVLYIVHKVSDDYTGWTFPYWKYPGQFENIYDDGTYRVYKNNSSFPRAFFADSFVVKANPKEILSVMFSNGIDLRREIVLEKNPGNSYLKSSDGDSVQVSSYSPNKIIINTYSKSEQLLFLSDPYYPGWQATVDGKNTEILRADYAFRAVKVPLGKHTIEFIFRPITFILGLYLAGLGLLGFLLTFILCKRHK